MKAIVITFNGEITNEQELVREIGALFTKGKNATIESSGLRLAILSDKDVCSLIVNKVAEENKKQKVTNEFEVFLKNIIGIVGSPKLTGVTAYKLAIINKIHNYKELRNSKSWSHIRKLDECEKLLLKQYGLEHLPSYIEDIADVFRIYGYGKV